jgi:integrase/recombinase XerD
MRQGVRAVKLKGLWQHPSGALYYRTRAGGGLRMVRLPDLPIEHPDFVAAWAAAAREGPAPLSYASGTIGSTWRAALASDKAATFSPSYRSIIAREARLICARAGDVKAAPVTERHIRADLRQSANPRARLKAWRFWARFCLDAGWLPADPAQGIKLDIAQGEGHPAWSPDEIAAYRAAYALGTVPRMLMELAFWTGARISDVVRIGPQHVGKDGVLGYRQTKTKDMAYVPWTCALPSWARGMQPDRDLCHRALAHAGPGMTWAQTVEGRARSHKAAGHVIAAACRAIDIEKSAHGLRKARAVALAEAGATPAQIGAWTGHSSLSEIVRYTRQMDRRGMVTGTEPERAGDTLDVLADTKAGKPL